MPSFRLQASGVDQTRRLLLLQNAAFLPLFREDPARLKPLNLDELEPAEAEKDGAPTSSKFLPTSATSRMMAARKVLTYLKKQPDRGILFNAARRLVS